MPMHRLKANSAGFTLIEMMIVLVIIGILLLVAVPGYQESMKKSRRADGMRDLMELTARQERFYAQYSEYTDDIDSPDGLNLERTTSSEGHYDLAVVACPGKDADDFSDCYILNAVPKDRQANDTECATLSVDSKGQRSASGTLGDACW
jgi:type IV pilus assembly protein PilE